MTPTTQTIAFFKAAGVFRVKTDEKARERFDEAFEDYKASEHCETFAPDTWADDLFAALIEYRENEKARKIAEEMARIAKREAREAKLAGMPIASGYMSVDEHIKRLPAGAYVLSAVQNNTTVHKDALAAILNFCNLNDASLLLGKVTYNKNGFQKAEDEEMWYAPELKPYIVEGQIDLGGYHFLADANVIPTATWPTSGFEANTPAGVGAIIPASKMELRVSAAGKNSATKIIAATGALTLPNYILRKTGAKAAAAHCISAIYLNTKTGEIRHLEYMPDAGCIYDTSGVYSNDGQHSLLKAGDVAAFQPGDIHAEKMDNVNLGNVIKLIKRLKPDNLLVHDLLDFSSRNHHNIKDPFFLVRQVEENNTVASDLGSMAGVLDELRAARKATSVHVVESNHDLAIDTWLKNVDWRVDPINAETYLDCARAKIKGGSSHNSLAWAYSNVGGGAYDDIVFHKTDEELLIAGVDMGNHGHNGANGSKGSPKQFAGLGVPMNTGHTHSPSIYGRCFTAGVTASLEMGYNIGASSWAIAHIVTYSNGQRQIIFG